MIGTAPLVGPTSEPDGPSSVERTSKQRVRLSDVQPGDCPPDDHPLDFRRALEDGEDLGVAMPAFDGVVPGVAVPAEDLDGLLGDPDRGLPRTDATTTCTLAMPPLVASRKRRDP
jgi:hypothetical protein